VHEFNYGQLRVADLLKTWYEYGFSTCRSSSSPWTITAVADKKDATIRAYRSKIGQCIDFIGRGLVKLGVTPSEASILNNFRRLHQDKMKPTYLSARGEYIDACESIAKKAQLYLFNKDQEIHGKSKKLSDYQLLPFFNTRLEKLRDKIQ